MFQNIFAPFSPSTSWNSPWLTLVMIWYPSYFHNTKALVYQFFWLVVMVDNCQVKKQKRAAETKKVASAKKATKTAGKVEPKVNNCMWSYWNLCFDTDVLNSYIWKCTLLITSQSISWLNSQLNLQKRSSRINYDALESMGGNIVSISSTYFCSWCLTEHPEKLSGFLLQQCITFTKYWSLLRFCSTKKAVNLLRQAGQLLILSMILAMRMRCITSTKMKISTMTLSFEIPDFINR